MCVCTQSLSHGPTFCGPLDCSLPGSSVHGLLQVRILEWVAIPYSRESSLSRDHTHVSCIADRFFIHWATWEAKFLECRSFTTLVRSIPRYFNLSDAIVSGISFQTPLSESSLLMYRHTTDFCILILYPANLPSSVIVVVFWCCI